MRSGRETRVSVALETAPETPREELVIRARSPLLGAKVANLSPALAEELRIDPSVEGVVVIEVPSGSRAEASGFQRGDIVVNVNNEQIGKTRDLDRVMQGSGRVWRFILEIGRAHV